MTYRKYKENYLLEAKGSTVPRSLLHTIIQLKKWQKECRCRKTKKKTDQLNVKIIEHKTPRAVIKKKMTQTGPKRNHN